ncbi:hypothetical protein NEMBOFW57_001245 [Staphylotrichum longicolle]|uniref:Uncharacterized protein n=1 Tax=Staphylotrichum longicolle TaxID=669026 RepID=A0AAD4F5N4_9PEZI|nr:hypothetical protein NEMBOFW57_001245 [Staphylotrichum longicolle]
MASTLLQTWIPEPPCQQHSGHLYELRVLVPKFKMLAKLSLMLAPLALLGSTALAAPAPEVPDALAPRQTACPTVTSWKAYSWSTVVLSTTTVTNRYSTLGSVTSSKTESLTVTLGTVSTVISPAVTTIPTSTTTATVAVETSTLVWDTITEKVTSPGYAPASECDVTTVTYTIPSTSSYTWTQAVSYATTWISTTGHVNTTTEVYYDWTTRTTTKAGSTTYDTTVTVPITWTSEEIVYETVTATIWAQGCQTYACQK